MAAWGRCPAYYRVRAGRRAPVDERGWSDESNAEEQEGHKVSTTQDGRSDKTV